MEILIISAFKPGTLNQLVLHCRPRPIQCILIAVNVNALSYLGPEMSTLSLDKYQGVPHQVLKHQPAL